MHKEEVELFLKRARNFLEGAKQRFERKDWDLTCFLAEQSVQLFLKAIILEKGGEFPRTHSLRQLFSILNNLMQNQELKYDRKSLLLLEGAYLNSRYINFLYSKEDAEEILNIVQEVLDLVRNVRNNETTS
jgi:HEPN domain-containing protein